MTRITVPFIDYSEIGVVENMSLGTLAAALVKLKRYEDAEDHGLLVNLPCNVGDKVLCKYSDYVFTIETVELGHKAGTLFRCGNPGTDDYMAFYDFEIGKAVEILTREEAEASLERRNHESAD